MRQRRKVLVVGTVATLVLMSCPNPLQEIIQRDVAPKYARIVVKLDTKVIDPGDVVDCGGAVIETAKETTFTIENTGTGALDLTGDPVVAVGGTDAASFVVTVPPTSPVTAGGNTWFTLSFTPPTTGAKQASITIESSDTETPSYTFSVAGEGTAVPQPEIALEGPQAEGIPTGTGSYDFGKTGIGLSREATFTIRNLGTADLALTGTPDRVLIAGDDATLFTVTKVPASPVAASTSTTFKVKFSPLTTGSKTASVSITNNDADENPYQFALAGEGALVPEMDVEQGGTGIPDGTGSYTWIDTQVGASTDVSFTIKNTGTGPLTLGSVSITGTHASLFSVITPPTGPVAAGSNTSFTVRFGPTSFGLKTATLSIANDDEDENPYSFSIQGTAFIGEQRITNATGYSTAPSLVWAGTEYGMAWVDSRNTPTNVTDIYFCRVNSVGLKQGSDVRITFTEPSSVGYPSLAWTGTEYGVAWNDSSTGQVTFARISSAGVKQGSDLQVSTGAVYLGRISLVWANGEYGVAWSEERDGNYEIYFARISSTGSRVAIPDPEPDGVNDDNVRITNNASYSYDPSLVWNGTEYGVAWWDERDGNAEIYFARISAAGAKQGSDMRITNAAQISEVPSLAWRGTEYGVAWCDYRDAVGNFEIYFARISAAGLKQGNDVRITNDSAGSSGPPSLAAAGTQYGVAWHDSRDGYWETYFARISSSGAKVGSDVPVGNAGAAAVSLAWTGTYFGLAWMDDRDGNDEIYFGVLASDGTRQ